MAAATQRKSSTRPSSPAGDEDVLDDMDLCGHGCHADGVPEGANFVGCEHGTYEVTDQMRRKAAAPAQTEPNVHAQQLHHEAKQQQPADTSAIGPLLEMVNAQNERIAVLEATVRQIIQHLEGPAADEDDGTGKTEG